MSRYIDIHAHVNFSVFNDDREAVINRAHEMGVAMINVGTQYDTSREAVALTERYDNVYAIVGLHPIHTSISHYDVDELGDGGQVFTSRGEVFDPGAYKELIAHPKVVGIGECGLDYFRLENDTKNIQRQVFLAQIALANEARKPLMLHIRNAYEDALEVLKAEARVRGNVHFFAGTWEEATRFLDLGFTLSFTGVVTFAKEYEVLVRNTPLDMLMAETDCPYVSPVPYRGKRNEPTYVVEIVRKIASIKDLPEEEVAEAIRTNARRVFGV